MQQALSMLASGSRLREIKAETGLHQAKVSLAARENGIRRGVFSETREAVALVTSETMSVPEAAEWTGIAAHKIYYAIRKQSEKDLPRYPKSADTEKWDAIFALREEGVSLADIGKQFNITRQRVHQILQKRASYKISEATHEQ